MNAVVIGAGVNELVAAHYLVRAGHRVIVLAARSAPDGETDETGWIPPRIVRDLALERSGLSVDRPDPWAVASLPNGGRLELWRDVTRSAESIRRASPRDADRWPAFCERMGKLTRVLETLYVQPPPDPVGRKLGDLVRLAGLALSARRLGRQVVEDLLRILPMPVADWLDDWFECDALKGILGAAGVMHLQQGPRSGGTAFRLLHHHVGSPPGVFRPPRSNIRRVLGELPGIEIRRGAEVGRISVREGRVAGIVLASGEEIAASLVVSGVDLRRTLLELIDPGWLDPDFVRAVRNVRCRGIVARAALTLDRAPGFSTFVIAPSLDYLERAYDDAKYGRVSQAPYLEAVSSATGTDGQHRVEVHVQYAPHALADGEWDGACRAALGELAVKMLTEHTRGLDATVLECRVLTPRDLESEYGFPEGQAHHLELALDQAFWMRPVPDWASYRMPIAGLYLCGPGTHPGGGIAGACGANAARVILRDPRRARLN